MNSRSTYRYASSPPASEAAVLSAEAGVSLQALFQCIKTEHNAKIMPQERKESFIIIFRCLHCFKIHRRLY